MSQPSTLACFYYERTKVNNEETWVQVNCGKDAGRNALPNEITSFEQND